MKRTLLTLLAMLSIATVMAKDSYLPTCIPQREYIYTGKDGIQIKIETSQEDFYPGFTLFDYSNGYRLPLRDAKSQIIRSFETQTPEMINLLKENFTAVEDGLVYFDYNLQEGDSINVIRFMSRTTSIMESYDIDYSTVKVLSIDSIEINSQIRLRYNLELRDYVSDLYQRPNDAKDGGYIYEYYEREELGKPYTNTWIEGIGYTSEDKYELQCVFEEGELIYGEEYVEEGSYLPTCVPLREYIYHNEQGESWRENTFLSEYVPGYIAYNEDTPGYYKVLREDGTRILRNYNNITNTPEMLALIKENFTTDGNDFVYFDYNLQIGDTLCVVELIDGKAGYLEGIWIDGKIIKVESIDVIEINAQPRARYILEAYYFSGYLEESRDKESGDYLYTYSIERIGKTYSDSWIEGIGYTKNNYDYELQCLFEEGELIYCADGADCKGLSDHANKKIDFTTLTLHRSGDALMAVFPTASTGETITLYDATGRAVAVQAVRQGATTATIDTTALPAGVYIARLNSGATAKVVL